MEDVVLKHPTEFREDGIRFAVSVTMKNIGNSPALSVALELECFYQATSTEKFADVEDRFKSRLRMHPAKLGHLIFPGDTFVQGIRWIDPPDKFAKSFSVRPTGETRFDFISIFIGISYRIVGDENVHITYQAHDLANVTIWNHSVARPKVPHRAIYARRRS